MNSNFFELSGAVHEAVLKINVKKLLKLEKTIDFLDM